MALESLSLAVIEAVASHAMASGYFGKVKRALDKMMQAVAERGDDLVEAGHQSHFRAQTPFYRLQVRAAPRRDYWVVSDFPVIYGHWLEGTGSRHRTTRFKGYWVFRTTTGILNRSWPRLVQPHVADLVQELN